MEGLTIETERGISLGDHHHNQGQLGGGSGGGGAEQDNERKTQNKGGRKKGGGGSGGNGSYSGGGNGGGMLRTPADIYDHPTFYSFILDMPGVDTQNIKVKVENGVLHVTGKRKKTKQSSEETTSSEGEVKALRLERRRARYMRKFTLPPQANHEDVKATYKDGVLTVNISKTPL